MATPVGHGSSLGQGLNQSHNCKLHHSCGNAGSFNPLCQAGIKPSTSTLSQATEVRLLTHCARAGTPVPSLQTVILCCYHGVVRDSDSIKPTPTPPESREETVLSYRESSPLCAPGTFNHQIQVAPKLNPKP